MRKIYFIAVLLLCAIPAVALAQDEELSLRLTRDFGYGAGAQIQGKFSLRVDGPDNVVKVDFIIDGETVHTATEPPYRYQFNTNEYAPGMHTMTAIGYKADGTPVHGAEFVRQFLSDDQAKSSTMKLIVPVLVIVGIATLLGALGPVLIRRGKEFKPGSYGTAGGAVCPRCTFPYARSIMAPNLVVGKLSRCPHCGKWAVVTAASQAALAAAEVRLAADNQGEVKQDSETEKLRQRMDESRFED